MAVGIFVVPFLCLGLLVFLFVRFAANEPKPSMLVVFLTCAQACIISVGPLMWDCSLSALAVASLSSLLVVLEVLYCGMRRHYASAMAAVGFCSGYYFFLLSVVASAAV
ncbi:MAG: hypothetical protein AB7K24_22310 [Gemmataceae bacterium]